MVKEKRGRKTNKKNEKGKKGCKKSKYFPKRDIARFAHDTRYEQYRSELWGSDYPAFRPILQRISLLFCYFTASLVKYHVFTNTKFYERASSALPKVLFMNKSFLEN